jgi:hypothetical protein
MSRWNGMARNEWMGHFHCIGLVIGPIAGLLGFACGMKAVNGVGMLALRGFVHLSAMCVFGDFVISALLGN